MNRNRKLKKAVASTTAVVLSACMVAAPALTVDSAAPEKEETVYVNMDASGNVEKITVSDWLKNAAGSAELSDSSSLSDIKNVKGDETFTQDGEKLTWQADGSDIYYQGTTDKELPVTVKLTYYLDGQEISPEDLAGKSGKVKIRIDYTNNEKETVKVNGEDREIYTPFAMISGMILSQDNFSNVKVTNGKVISDGSRNIVVGVALPGLSESIGLSDTEDLDDIDIPDYVEVEADTTNFKLDMTATVATTGVLDDLGIENLDDLKDLKDSLDELTENSLKLVDGSSDLADGTSDLKDGVDDLVDGVSDLSDGASDLYDGVKKVDDGAGDLQDGAKQLADGAGDLQSGAAQLQTGAGSLQSGAGSLQSGARSLANGAGSVKSGASDLSDGATTLSNGLNTLNTKSKDLVDGINQLNDGKGALVDGLNTLVKGITSADTGAKSLKTGVDSYTKGADSLADGTTAYVTGAGQYTSAVNSYLSGEETLNEGVQSFASQAGTLPSSMKDLYSGISTAKTGSDALVNEDTTSKLIDGITNLHESIVAIQNMIPSSSEGGSTGSEGEAATASYASIAEAVSGVDEELSNAIATLQSSIDTEESVIADLNSVLATAQSYYNSYSGAANVMEKLGSGTVSQAISDYQSVVDKLNSDITALTEKRNEQIAERDALQSVSASAENCVVLAESAEEGGTTEKTPEELIADLSKALAGLEAATNDESELKTGVIQYVAGAQELNAGLPTL